MKTIVIDIDPISPAIGGSRMRLLGLYHNIGFKCKYIGTYTWPGENFRSQYLTENLEEILIPLSNEHFNEVNILQQKIPGKTIIDSTFNLFAHHSVDYIETVKKEISDSEIIIFSHPWVYPLVKDVIRKNQIIIYDSQNFEGLLRKNLLGDSETAKEIIKNVYDIENELCQAADAILTCSHEDRVMFNKEYKIPFSKMFVFPNGTFTENIKQYSSEEKVIIKNKLNIDKDDHVLTFIGSDYGPNNDAAYFIVNELAKKLPDFKFLICGSVCNNLFSLQNPNNVILKGIINDIEKSEIFSITDIALNPIFSGSGTNVKMFDYMSHGLPIISSDTGARGIETLKSKPFIICKHEEMVNEISNLIKNSSIRNSLSTNAQSTVKIKYSWEAISKKLGVFLKNKIENKNTYFSIIVATYNRNENLFNLLKKLEKQTYKNFEVIIVDQSEQSTDLSQFKNLDIKYVHSKLKGAVFARNMAAYIATGNVIAFTDDDCEPSNDWLLNAKNLFDMKLNIIGIEGMVDSGDYDSSKYRGVSNKNCRGIGFMTANLFLEREIFNAIDGFDEKFETPHFREDTDLGWRALEFGEIIFSEDVFVFHPPHSRDDNRESLDERDKFFENDIFLMKKHPEKYKHLFLMECHFNNPNFWKHLLNASIKYNIHIDEFYFNYCNGVKKMEVLSNVPEDFDWKFYLGYHKDLRNYGLKTKQDAEKHYLESGQFENRLFKNKDFNFDKNIDVTIAGVIDNTEGLGKVIYCFNKMLSNTNLKYNILETHKNYNLDYLPTNYINSNTIGKIFINTNFPNEIPPNVGNLNFIYSMYESDQIHKEWVDNINLLYDGVIVPDEWVSEVYKKSGVVKPIYILPIGIECDSSDEKTEDIKRNNFTFGINANYELRKNHEQVIESFVQIWGNNKSFSLKVHGKTGYLYNALKEKYKNYDNVHITTGALTEVEIHEWYNDLDCFILISKGEGYSLTPREASLKNIPLILSNYSAHETLVQTGGVLGVNPSWFELSYKKDLFNDYIGSHAVFNLQDIKDAMEYMVKNHKQYKKKIKLTKEWILKNENYDKLSKTFHNLIVKYLYL